MTTVDVSIAHATTDADIAASFAVMRQLRPRLDADSYVGRVRQLMESEGLRLLTLREDGVVRAVAAYRVMDMLYCGRLLYVDDLVTDQAGRSRGYGKRILACLRTEARDLGCSEIQLISRVTREQAHRFYFREGFGIECFHFRYALGDDPEPAASAGAGA